MKTLSVLYEGLLVGRLTRDDELVYGFAYDEAWLRYPQRFPLSLALPLDAKTFGNKTTLSFFENLLPEGEVKEQLQRAHGVAGVFDFLQRYGRDCAGAVIVTDQEAQAQPPQAAETVAIDMERVYGAIDEHQSVADVIADMNPGYLSLAGAQDKFPAIYDGKEFRLPTLGAPTTHIIKAPIQHSGIKESVFNEWYCMELARAVGLLVPKCLVTSGRHPLYVVERYDRYRGTDDLVHRIHQQDLCQAQGITSEFKYEDHGGPGIKQLYQLIQSSVASSKIVTSLQTFLDWLAFNLLIGNHDCHAKNISLLFKDGRNEIAPFYDLICTAIYPRLKRNFCFSIGGRTEFSTLGVAQFKQLEQDLSLRPGTFSGRLAKIAGKVAFHKEGLARTMCQSHPRAKIPLRISALIDDRMRSLRL